MKGEKIIDVCKIYSEKLKGMNKNRETLKHLEWMIKQIPGFLLSGRIEKANRWLGFIQGVLWEKKIYNIEEVKGHNRS